MDCCLSLNSADAASVISPVTAVLMHITAKYFITYTPICSALAVAAVSAKLRAILLNIICKILQLCHFVNSVHNGQFCTELYLKDGPATVVGLL